MPTGKKVRLTIAPCNTKGGQMVASKEKAFEVMLNPSSYSYSAGIDYSKTKALGKSASEAKFNTAEGDRLTFKFVLDGTGVVEPATLAGSVTDRVQKLREVVYDYVGDKHEPNVVRVLWGTFIFYGRLQSMSIDYNLFKPSGEPLRAQVNLTFIGTMGSREEARKANRSSPDLTHVVEFKAGDSLPLLCYRIYEDSAYYMAVARYNRITNFRAIKPGQKLLFPPLR
ncbi:MAG: peptidoglycan-binding protein [Rhodocyclaceae bacterium]|nr:peptidoglycan-binding protein [Rhodocyclaceae bacterium]